MYFLQMMAPIMNGIAAKNLCSCVFVGGIDEEKAKHEDLGFFPVSLANANIDFEDKSASSTLFGLGKRKAVFREGFGCVLINKISEEVLRAKKFEHNLEFPDSLVNWWDREDSSVYLSNVQQQKLEKAVQWAFEEEPEKQKNTRAVVVIYKGKLIYEQYAEGITKQSRLLGWSMNKSITASLVGLLQEEGRLEMNQKAPIKQWKNTEKEAISIKNLLQMNSGLSFNESYFSRSDVTQMLFENDSMGLYATTTPLIHPVGEFWNYASGTTNIVAYLSSLYFDSLHDYHMYPYEKIFSKIGMKSMLMETDGAGFFMGSSYAYATARDWAKLGQLYLNEGKWNGVEVLPKWWVDFVKIPAEGSNGAYGGQFWLNAGGEYPDVPRDAFSMNGFQGQKVYMIPSKDLVIVRLGLTYKRGDFDFNYWFKKLLEALES